MSASVQVDLVHDEIITTQTSIAFEVPKGADTRELARLMMVRGVDGTVRATRRKSQYRWSPPEDIRPGRYWLVFEKLADDRSRPLTDAVEIPFTMVDTKANIPSRLRLESFSRVRYRDSGIVERLPLSARPRSKYVEFFKAIDRRTGKPVELAFDQDGNKLDPDAIVSRYHKRTSGSHGRIHPALADRIEEAGRAERVRVDVWIAIDEPDPTQADRPLHDCDDSNAATRAQETRQQWLAAGRRLADEISKTAKVIDIDELAPVVTVELPASAIRELASQDGIAAIFLHEEEGIDDLEDSIAVARSSTVHASGETGTGVRAAVWEGGPTSNTDLVIAGRYRTDPATSNHSQNVHAIIRNAEKGTPNGHAPGCSLYSANDTKRAALRWAVKDQDCTVVNQSFHRSSEPGSDSLSGDDLYGDWLALHWPYPLIVHAAGNFWEGDPDDIDPPSDEYVNHKGYNSISVGNHNDAADAMSGGSVFRNPSSPHGDRELPEISANGTSVTADGLMFTGTSQASPAVGGVAALLQGTAPTLEHWPEGCRAILAAGATRNVRDDTWWRDVVSGVDARDGAGAVNAAESRAIALVRRWRDAPPAQRGWDIGQLTSSDFGADRLSTFQYQVKVPGYVWGPRKVKIALAWTSKVTSILGLFHLSSLAVDLDLKVFDKSGVQVGYSGSWDNSYEIAEFIGNPGEMYTIRIRRWSGSEATWYGIAWTVTGGPVLVQVPMELAQVVLTHG